MLTITCCEMCEAPVGFAENHRVVTRTQVLDTCSESCRDSLMEATGGVAE